MLGSLGLRAQVASTFHSFEESKILLEYPTRAVYSDFSKYLMRGKKESRVGVFKEIGEGNAPRSRL